MEYAASVDACCIHKDYAASVTISSSIMPQAYLLRFSKHHACGILKNLRHTSILKNSCLQHYQKRYLPIGKKMKILALWFCKYRILQYF